jgi:ATP-dependent Clp protease ATP-binding subunit ClpC
VVFERFTERARRVVVLAQEEARTLGHDYIGTEHLLLGLLREEDGVAARVLTDRGIAVELARAQIIAVKGSGAGIVAGQVPFTPRGKRVLEASLREALALGHDYIGTEHILLGLVRETDGVAARILLERDVDAEKIRREVMRVLSASGGRAADAPQPSPQFTDAPPVASGIPELFGIAATIARDESRSVIELGDLLLALTRQQDTAAVLTALGIDETAMRKAIRLATDAAGPEVNPA